jgi:hypothetical protein
MKITLLGKSGDYSARFVISVIRQQKKSDPKDQRLSRLCCDCRRSIARGVELRMSQLLITLFRFRFNVSFHARLGMPDAVGPLSSERMPGSSFSWTKHDLCRAGDVFRLKAVISDERKDTHGRNRDRSRCVRVKGQSVS